MMEEVLKLLLDTVRRLETQISEIRSDMAKVAANSSVVVSTVESHGNNIARLEKRITKIDLHCPLMVSEVPPKCTQDRKGSNTE